MNSNDNFPKLDGEQSGRRYQSATREIPEYVLIVENVCQNIKYLKRELTEMHQQDIRLLRQLIKINDIIHNLSQRLTNDIVVNEKRYLETHFFDGAEQQTLRVIRQKSDPHHGGGITRQRFSSSIESSFEDIEEHEDASEPAFQPASHNNAQQTDYEIQKRRSAFRPRSQSHEIKRTTSEQYDDKMLADLLHKNVKLWKASSKVSKLDS